MKQTSKYLIIIASIMTTKLTVIESTGENANNGLYHHLPIFTNVCEIIDRRTKIHCYCDNSKPKTATRADCWIFGGGLTESDAVWPNFSSQSEIEHLTFNVRSDDALTFIPAKAIIRLDRLKYISIQFGTIKKIRRHAFTNSSTITQIVLKSNKITSLEKQSFSHMPMLSNLSLDDNLISELRRDVFYNLPNLHVLHLSNNNISLIHEGCFKHLSNLIELKLDFNYISVITREMLEGLENLSRLNLRNNKLTMIGNLAFSELWALKELILDGNIIEYLSERAFGGIAQLKKLTLSNNKITVLYEDVFEDLKSLNALDLRENHLQSISYETIQPIVVSEKSGLTAIYLEGNPFNCNCRLSWIYTLRNETKDIMLKDSLEKVSCINDQPNDRRLNDQKVIEEGNDNTLADDTYDYYDKNDEYKEQRKAFASRAVKLSDLPLQTLPCPMELRESMDENYGHPVQNEIRLKSFSKANKILPSIILLLIKFIL